MHDTQTTYKTCLFKIHNPSKHKRAMMLDCLQRNQRAYWKVLDTLRPLAEEHAAITRVIADKVKDLKYKISQRKNDKIKNESKEEC